MSTAPVLVLTVPKEYQITGNPKVEITLHYADFDRSWLEYFQLRAVGLYKKLSTSPNKNILEIVNLSTKKSFTLNDTVKQFVDSFNRNRKKYTADLKLMARAKGVPTTNGVPRTQPTPRPGPSSRPEPVPVNQAPRGKRSNPTPVPPVPASANKRRVYEEDEIRIGAGMGIPSGSKVPPAFKFARKNATHVDYDAASMADSMDSQDSQSDLVAAGVAGENIKTDVIKNITRQADNNALLRIREELRVVKREAQWMRLTRKIPQTANFLQLVFDF